MSKRKIMFDPETPLLGLPVVRLSFLIIVGSATLLSVILVLDGDLKPQWDYHGFNHFLEVFRVPLAVIALLVPVIALYGANHRSEQTRKQIQVSQSQNNFANHFKHIEEFEKYLIESL